MKKISLLGLICLGAPGLLYGASTAVPQTQASTDGRIKVIASYLIPTTGISPALRAELMKRESQYSTASKLQKEKRFELIKDRDRANTTMEIIEQELKKKMLGGKPTGGPQSSFGPVPGSNRQEKNSLNIDQTPTFEVLRPEEGILTLAQISKALTLDTLLSKGLPARDNGQTETARWVIKLAAEAGNNTVGKYIASLPNLLKTNNTETAEKANAELGGTTLTETDTKQALELPENILSKKDRFKLELLTQK